MPSRRPTATPHTAAFTPVPVPAPANPRLPQADPANGRTATAHRSTYTTPVILIGTGRLRDAVHQRLLQAGPAGGRGPVVAVTDGWDPEWIARVAAGAAADGVPFLGVQVELGRAVVGPAVVPGVAGCGECLAVRRAAVDFGRAEERAALLARHGGRLAGPSVWLTAFAVHAIAGIVAAEAVALAGGGGARTRGAVVVVELDRLATAVHPFLPDPLCRTCAPPPVDGGPGAAEVGLVSRPKPGPPATLRVTDIGQRAEEVLRTYADGFAGLVHEVRERDACGLPVAYAPTGLPRFRRSEPGIGRATDRRAAGLAAVLEAVERRAGIEPSGPRGSRWAAFEDIAGQAVDPRTLGLHEPERYDGRPGVSDGVSDEEFTGESPDTSGTRRQGYARFDPARELEWVWGYSFGRAEPVLVPRAYAYFGPAGTDAARDPAGTGGRAGRPLVHETSNGCALGGCYEEAVVHGLLEVAERDALLLTWYARMPVPRIALASARSAEIRLLADRIRREHGYRVLFFDTSLEHGIPSVALLAVDLTPGPLRPAVMCSAAAHVDPERACWAALTELALTVAHLTRVYPEQRERAAAMAADSALVREMADHQLVYGHASTLPRWDFLLRRDGRPGECGDSNDDADAYSFAESFRGRPAPSGDLREDLTDLLDRYRWAGLDVIAVDQTGPEQRAAGLSAVKVVVPGTLPMTFGHADRRVRGLPRLRTVPVRLGHRTDALPQDGTNPYPHPFS